MKDTLKFFEQAHAKKRMAHLYLIQGLKGSGKLKLALEVAYLILKQEHQFADVLKQQIMERKSSNVIVIEPEGLSIKKEQIIALQKEFSKTSLVSGPRVYIISMIEKMTLSAANSLLKFMEEPSNKETYGFLLTEDQASVLSTIVSRSQLVTLKSLSESELKQQLIDEQVDAQMAAFIPYLTKNLDEAMQLAIDPNYIELMHFMTDFAKVWHQKDQSLLFFFMRNSKLLTYDRAFYKSFVELLLLYFLDLIYYKTHQTIVLDFLKEEIQLASAHISIEKIEKITSHIKASLKTQNFNINLELSLDQLAYMLDQSR
jgi:DNA polymerase III subunit delta'